MKSIFVRRIYNKNLNGFTLVELLVVISVIAMLLSILMPSLSKARDSARAIVCSSNLKNIGLATLTYLADNNGKYPAAFIYDSAGVYGERKFWGFSGFLDDYLAVNKRSPSKIWSCPTVRNLNRNNPNPPGLVRYTSGGVSFWYSTVYVPNANILVQHRVGSTTYPEIMLASPDHLYSSGSAYASGYTKDTDVRQPSVKLMLTEWNCAITGAYMWNYYEHKYYIDNPQYNIYYDFSIHGKAIVLL